MDVSHNVQSVTEMLEGSTSWHSSVVYVGHILNQPGCNLAPKCLTKVEMMLLRLTWSDGPLPGPTSNLSSLIQFDTIYGLCSLRCAQLGVAVTKHDTIHAQ